MRLRGRHEASLQLTPDRISATADNGGFVLAARRSGADITLSEMRLAIGGGTMTVTGAINRDRDRIDLQLNGEDIPVDFWPPIVERYPQAAGTAGFEGRINGKLSAPSTDPMG